MLKRVQITATTFISALLLLPCLTLASSDPVTLEQVLAMQDEPDGVVIEIVTGSDDALEWALPQSKQYIEKLRKRFPGLPVAIVTHGREQFALAKNNRNVDKKVHSLTQALQKEGVPLHVCGTYAGWEGMTEEDFPEYVDVSAAGPAQINDYKAVGFLHIIIDEDS